MTGVDWDPALYSRFADVRTRPARDLLARCGELKPWHPDGRLRVADLGCGPGNSTELLAERFPDALVSGFDTSGAMLEAARTRLPGCRFERADIAGWAPAEPFDLVFTNAALQWVRGHERLIPRLFAQVARGGLFAAQVPDNLGEPSQTAMQEISREPAFASHLSGAEEGRETIAPLEAYYDWLAPAASSVDVWVTHYNHPMESAAAITEWFRSTGLKPFLDPLPDDLKSRFAARYTAEMERFYAPRTDGLLLLAFPRMFFVARRSQA